MAAVETLAKIRQIGQISWETKKKSVMGCQSNGPTDHLATIFDKQVPQAAACRFHPHESEQHAFQRSDVFLAAKQNVREE